MVNLNDYATSMSIDPANGKPMPNFSLTGSNVYEPYDSLVATATEQVLTFPQPMKSVMLSNDGTSDVLIGLQGKTVSPTIHDNVNSAWAFTGTWYSSTNSSLYKYGTDVQNSNTTGSKATYKPNITTNILTLATIKGTSVGIATLELSNDMGLLGELLRHLVA